jgi:4a-hydroxytetrahydrobiopterin dehydratase
MNPEQLSAPLQSLLEEKQWALDEEGMGVAKIYYFKTYTKCLVRFSLTFLVFC